MPAKGEPGERQVAETRADDLKSSSSALVVFVFEAMFVCVRERERESVCV